MLNVDIVKEDNQKIEIKTWLPRKSKASDDYHIYEPEQIKNLIDDKIKETYKDVESYEFLTEVLKIKNKMPSHRHEHNILIKLKKKKKSNKKPKVSKS
tara:strand:- start:249 stop:542 length:294 start_codon:yes stop_codon:yes gene_type:complete